MRYQVVFCLRPLNIANASDIYCSWDCILALSKLLATSKWPSEVVVKPGLQNTKATEVNKNKNVWAFRKTWLEVAWSFCNPVISHEPFFKSISCLYMFVLGFIWQRTSEADGTSQPGAQGDSLVVSSHNGDDIVAKTDTSDHRKGRMVLHICKVHVTLSLIQIQIH